MRRYLALPLVQDAGAASPPVDCPNAVAASLSKSFSASSAVIFPAVSISSTFLRSSFMIHPPLAQSLQGLFDGEITVRKLFQHVKIRRRLLEIFVQIRSEEHTSEL